MLSLHLFIRFGVCGFFKTSIIISFCCLCFFSLSEFNSSSQSNNTDVANSSYYITTYSIITISTLAVFMFSNLIAIWVRISLYFFFPIYILSCLIFVFTTQVDYYTQTMHVLIDSGELEAPLDFTTCFLRGLLLKLDILYLTYIV